VVGICHGNWTVDKKLTITGQSSDQMLVVNGKTWLATAFWFREVPIEWVQEAMNTLEQDGEVKANVEELGYRFPPPTETPSLPGDG
jgi:hypothetical protein